MPLPVWPDELQARLSVEWATIHRTATFSDEIAAIEDEAESYTLTHERLEEFIQRCRNESQSASVPPSDTSAPVSSPRRIVKPQTGC